MARAERASEHEPPPVEKRTVPIGKTTVVAIPLGLLWPMVAALVVGVAGAVTAYTKIVNDLAALETKMNNDLDKLSDKVTRFEKWINNPKSFPGASNPNPEIVPPTPPQLSEAPAAVAPEAPPPAAPRRTAPPKPVVNDPRPPTANFPIE